MHCASGKANELYDLALDPGETENLAASRAAEAQRLEAELWKLLRIAGCGELPVGDRSGPGGRDLSPEQLEALRRLGYVED